MLKKLFVPAGEHGPAVTILLTPIFYQEFMALDLWSGASDMAYAEFLRHNELADPADYDEEVLKISYFILTEGEYHLEFNPSGDDNGWITVPPMSNIPRRTAIDSGLTIKNTDLLNYWGILHND